MSAEQEASERWRHGPPYQTPAELEQFEKKHEGACHCGRVRYFLSRERPLASKYCHCRECQVLHGAPFQWAAIFHKTDMAFETGAEGLAFYSSGTMTDRHELPCKVSCEYCRTLIMDEGRKMVLLFPTLIKFSSGEERRQFSPDCHIFYPSRVVDIPDGKPKWAGMDGKSAQLDLH